MVPPPSSDTRCCEVGNACFPETSLLPGHSSHSVPLSFGRDLVQGFLCGVGRSQFFQRGVAAPSNLRACRGGERGNEDRMRGFIPMKCEMV